MKPTVNSTLKYQAFIFLLVSYLVLFPSCTHEGNTNVSDEPEASASPEDTYELTPLQFESSNLKLAKLDTNFFHEVVKANGVFAVPPMHRASVSCYFGGTVKVIKVLPGERVRKGQVLFILENPDYVHMQQDFLEAKGQLKYLKSDYERQRNLAQDNITSQKNYLKAESDYTVARVKVESLSKQLALMNIDPNTLTIESIRATANVLSPIGGYVTEVDISTGTYLSNTMMAVSIVDTDYLHLELNIFEKDLAKVDIGQAIQFRTQEDNRNNYEASVQLVNKSVGEENRTISILGHLSDKALAGKFAPGMYVEADILTASEAMLSLPAEAFVEIEGKFYLLALQGNSDDGYTFVKREAKTGQSNNSHIEILNSEDFNEDTQFLVKGAFNLIAE